MKQFIRFVKESRHETFSSTLLLVQHGIEPSDGIGLQTALSNHSCGMKTTVNPFA